MKLKNFYKILEFIEKKNPRYNLSNPDIKKNIPRVPVKGKGTFDDNGAQGEWEVYKYGRISSKGAFKNNKEDGYWEYYESEYNSDTDDYDFWIDIKTSFKDGKLNGDWRSYYENGKVYQQGKFIDNKRNGLWAEYYDNGKLKIKGNYVDDSKEGEWIYYNSKGMLTLKGSYENDKKIGLWKELNQNRKENEPEYNIKQYYGEEY